MANLNCSFVKIIYAFFLFFLSSQVNALEEKGRTEIVEKNETKKQPTIHEKIRRWVYKKRKRLIVASLLGSAAFLTFKMLVSTLVISSYWSSSFDRFMRLIDGDSFKKIFNADRYLPNNTQEFSVGRGPNAYVPAKLAQEIDKKEPVTIFLQPNALTSRRACRYGFEDLSNFLCMHVDYPGVDGSKGFPWSARHCATEQVERIESTLQAKSEFSERPILIHGHSMGGWIGVLVAEMLKSKDPKREVVLVVDRSMRKLSLAASNMTGLKHVVTRPALWLAGWGGYDMSAKLKALADVGCKILLINHKYDELMSDKTLKFVEDKDRPFFLNGKSYNLGVVNTSRHNAHIKRPECQNIVELIVDCQFGSKAEYSNGCGGDAGEHCKDLSEVYVAEVHGDLALTAGIVGPKEETGGADGSVRSYKQMRASAALKVFIEKSLGRAFVPSGECFETTQVNTHSGPPPADE